MSKYASFAFLPVLAMTSVNCMASATQSAVFSRVPVLVGPVPCVGCGPRQTKASTLPGLSDYAQTTWWWFTNHSSLSYAPSQLNEKVAQVQDPCQNEFVLRKLGTSAFAINALAMTYESATMTLAADLVTIPSGSCDLTLERWPLSGPHGISWPAAPPPAYGPTPNQSTLPRKASKAGAS